MIPMYLVTGFLGSGKTTLLKEIYHHNSGRRFIYLINEFSIRDVDTEILDIDAEGVISVPGGSIFCTCLVGEFVSRLRNILQKQEDQSRPFEGLIIEASGIANPSVIQTLLTETKLDDQFEIRRIISVVDPFTLPKLLHTLPNIKEQIMSADLVIMNKTDLVDNREVEALRKTIRELNTDCLIENSRFCALSVNPLSGDLVHKGVASKESAHQPQTAFKKFSMQNRKRMHMGDFLKLIDSHPGDFYRVKGFYRGENGQMMHLDYSLSSGLKTIKTDEDKDQHLEFIFNGDKSEILNAAIKKFFKEAFF